MSRYFCEVMRGARLCVGYSRIGTLDENVSISFGQIPSISKCSDSSPEGINVACKHPAINLGHMVLWLTARNLWRSDVMAI